MREVIQKLIETEAEATRLVASAKRDAESLIAVAQTQAQSLIAGTKRELPCQRERIIQTAVEEAEREKQARESAAAAHFESELRLDAATAERLVEAGVQTVCGHSL